MTTQELADLCDGGYVCDNGMCQPVDPGLPPDEGQPVGMPHLLRSAHSEAAKRERPMTETETRGWA